MATLYVRDVPDDVVALLKQEAKEEHRSLSAHVASLLCDHACRYGDGGSREAALDRLLALRDATRPPSGGDDALTLLRESRDR